MVLVPGRSLKKVYRSGCVVLGGPLFFSTLTLRILLALVSWLMETKIPLVTRF